MGSMEHVVVRRLEEASGMLPSYQDATTRPDWLDLVAPYIPIGQYARLCLVSRRFYHQFAPRLWNDPVAVVCLLNPVLDPECFLGLLEHAARIQTTSSLPSFVRSLDTRCLFADTSALSHSTFSTRTLSGLLFSASRSFPQLRCIFLDGYPGLAPETAVDPASTDRPPSFEPPLLLSIPRCQVELPASFFTSTSLRSLVYLDVSDMPGSLRTPLVQRTLSAANLPSLRILKAQGREIDNATAMLLFKVFWEQLWSVDLSRNRLSDDMLEVMHQYSFPSQTSRTGDFAVEGRISYAQEASTWFGSFCFVNESKWSASFSHPHRHLVDAPFYTPHIEDGPLPSASPRLNGRVKIRPDSADAIKTMFSGNAGSRGPPLEYVRGLDICRGHQGITHLHLNGNKISAGALAKMIRLSPGQLQHLECDSLSFKLPDVPAPSWLSKVRLSGTLGWAHVFRPVFSANLQVLRIHHSLVTQLPSLGMDGLSPMANLWVAETRLLPRAELAYPEAFVPDMNPRLQSLVLTGLPRHSTGPLIEKLVNFLKLASMQERAIQEVGTAGRHGPATLLGLRHIRLEFQPDHREEESELGESDGEFDIDAAAIMGNSSEEFSFFSESSWSSSPSTSKPSSSTLSGASEIPSPSVRHPVPEPRDTINQSARPGLPRPRPPSPETCTSPETHPETQHQNHIWTWHSTRFTVPIWIGPGAGQKSSHSHTRAVQEYMRLLRAHPEQLQSNPVPASPCHVAAGVPAGEYIFSAAWEAILIPPPSPSSTIANRAGRARDGGGSSGRNITPPKPTRAELQGMKDVIAAIKEYRAQTRRAYAEACRQARENGEKEVRLGEPHFHWTGKLEVLAVDDYAASRFWR